MREFRISFFNFDKGSTVFGLTNGPYTWSYQSFSVEPNFRHFKRYQNSRQRLHLEGSLIYI